MILASTKFVLFIVLVPLLGSQGDGHDPASVNPSTIIKIFSSETAWPIKAKFYMKQLQEGGTNVYINNLGHMTKMAATPR